MSEEQRQYSSLDPGRLATSGDFSFVPAGGNKEEEEEQQEGYLDYNEGDSSLYHKASYSDHQTQNQQDYDIDQNEPGYYDGEDQVYQEYEDQYDAQEEEEEEDSYERQKQEIIEDLQNQTLSEQVSEQTSVYTLEDTDTPQQPTEVHPHGHEIIYDLPTHISSHYDVLKDGAITQPATPVSEPFKELPPHRLRPLSQTNLSTQIAEEEPLVKPPVAREGAVSSEAEDWDERGAAKIIQKKTNQITGEEEEFIIKRSVKDFKFGKNIGFGSYSTVILATDKNTAKNFAVKVLDKRHIIKEKKVKYVNIEKNTLNRLGARNGIIRFFFTFQDESSLYFVLDFAANGELLNLIKKYGSLTEETTRYYAAQILDAIKYMHDNGVIHRDLKPENILLDDQMRVQITDFGTAKLLEKNPETGVYPLDTRAKSFVGTAEYVSPELLNEKAVGKSCDVWAFGCIVYQMIAGKPPFKATNEYLTFQKIVKLQYAFTAGFPMVVRDLIKRILVLNPNNRYSIKNSMKHLFFQGIDFSDPAQVWGADPPEVKGPYKINAKSMLPVPELLNTGMPKTRVSVPRKASSSMVAKRKGTTAEQAVVSMIPPVSPSLPPGPTPAPNKPFTASQQVLQRAKEKVAARKAQQMEERNQDRQQNTVKATSAASIALTKQPGDIIKQVNEQKELKRFAESQESNPSSAVPSRQVSYSSTNGSKSATKATSAGSSQPSASSNAPSTPPINPLDIKYSHHIRLSAGERVLHDGLVTFYQTTVDVLARKYKGKLKDITSGGNTLLSQVANGSYRGLRNMDRQGEEVEKSIISEYDTSEYGAPAVNDDEFFKESRTFKIRKFFNYGGGGHSTTAGGGEDQTNGPEEGDGIRDRVLIVTNMGRLLFLQRFNNDKDELSLALRVEISLNHPMIKVREFISSAENLSPSQNSMKSFFVVEAYQRAFVVECYKSDVAKWCRAISEAKTLAEEKNTQSQPPSSASSSSRASTATGLGVNTMSSSSNGASTRRPSGQTRSVSQTGALRRSTTQSAIKSPKVYPSSASKSPVIPQNAPNPSSAPVTAPAPSKPRLFHGLPLPESTKPPASSSSSASSLEKAAATQANILTKAAKLAIASHPQSAANHGATPGNINANGSERRPQVTGMNSRMLARSLGQRKR
ncbi:hypothetical protein WICPIJ_000485 [Wickerhamomyces pijperi]|uniref:non-specific serine/threonine protein kinase n=1 Tax=Wickerhamomyces pijperi TaxID=599730 RepID=A0A9P8TRW1_WICPI|nr:hypothetical protein WICPIJ_000485 [Wickerhamomyces pijperi]